MRSAEVVQVSPRIVGCLFLSIVAGIASFVWALSAGWGLLLALLAYSCVGSLALLLAAGAAAAVEFLRETAEPPSQGRSRQSFGPATAHSG